MDVSLFEIIGPKMMGPSSSATAGMVQLGATCHKFLTGPISSIDLRFVPSMEQSYYSWRSHLALIGGVIGIKEDDSRLLDAIAICKEQGISLSYSLFKDPVPPMQLTVQITCEQKNGEVHTLYGISVGGGSIKVEQIDGFSVAPTATEAHLFVFADQDVGVGLMQALSGCTLRSHDEQGGKHLYCISVPEDAHEALQKAACTVPGVTRAQYIAPFVTLGFVPHEPLFTNYSDILELSKKTGKTVPELAIEYEINRSGRTREAIWNDMAGMLDVMKTSAKESMGQTLKPLCGFNSGNEGKKILAAYQSGKLLGGTIMPKALALAVGIMEYSGSCHSIVACPTAGCSGLVPACLLTVAEAKGLGDEKLIESLFVAAAIGAVMAHHKVSFSGNNGGCQGEVGVGSAMTASALAYLGGGDTETIIQACALAMKNILGLICDPLKSGGEIPCIKRNGVGVGNAFSGCDMALSGVKSFIPCDEVIDSLYHIQEKLFRSPEFKKLKNTEGIGASWTPTGKATIQTAQELSRDILLPKKEW